MVKAQGSDLQYPCKPCRSPGGPGMDLSYTDVMYSVDHYYNVCVCACVCVCVCVLV